MTTGRCAADAGALAPDSLPTGCERRQACRGPTHALAVPLLLGHAGARAGEAGRDRRGRDPRGDGTWRVEVTVEHADEGWDHYADAWEVVAPDGTVLGTRTLLHPHETEQPFIRALSGVAIPDDVAEVTIRARDSVHGFGGRELSIVVPRE